MLRRETILRLILVSSLAVAAGTHGIATVLPQGQATQGREAGVLRYCGAAELRTGDEFDQVQRITKRFGPMLTRTAHHILIAVVAKNEVNATTHFLAVKTSLICVPMTIVKL